MKKKLINIVIDILLIAIVFSATDFILLKVLHSQNTWLDLGTYLVLYASVFGAKRAIILLCKRLIAKKDNNS